MVRGSQKSIGFESHVINPGENLTLNHPPEPKKSVSNRGRLWQLEALRGFAAFYVVLHHTSSNYLHLKNTIWGFPFRFGLEAVLTFFILSGFVICYSHHHADGGCDSFKTYFIKRTRRIYPLFILSLVLAQAIASVSARGWAPVDFRQLFGNLFMLQNLPSQPGLFCLPFGDNMPLWSLSFEWWFYLLFFPINRWVPRATQKFLVLGLAMIGLLVNQFHPNVACWFLIFFIIWWTGAELAHEFRRTGDVTLAGQKSMLLLIGVPLAWFAVISWNWHRDGRGLPFNAYPFFDFRYFLMTPLFIGLLIAWRQIRFAGFNQTLGHFERLGAISFGLYVFHYPILCDLRLLGSERLYYVDLVLRIGLAFLLAWLAEGVLQKRINHWTNPWLRANKS